MKHKAHRWFALTEQANNARHQNHLQMNKFLGVLPSACPACSPETYARLFARHRMEESDARKAQTQRT